MSERVFAAAKINLTLEVGSPLADGMHPIQSAVVFADVGDWIEAAPADALSLEIVGLFARDLSAGEDNLVLRAARALARTAARPVGARLRLEKNLPVASGIGGGSADAAATLRALNKLWRLGLDMPALADIARQLGADAPVCVIGRSAFMTGIGADFSFMEIPMLSAVLVNPLAPLSTAEVYRQFDAMGRGGALAPRTWPRWRSVEHAVESLREVGNQLEAPAVALAPRLADIRTGLEAKRPVRLVGLSGSGATMFALVDTQGQAASLANELASQWPRYWIRPARLNGV